jgi:biopolymer transport protein ExbD
LQDKVAIGSGHGRQLLTVAELKEFLKVLAEAASSSGSEGFVSMASDKDVPLRFGLKILTAIDTAGIPNVLLATHDHTGTPSQETKPLSPISK